MRVVKLASIRVSDCSAGSLSFRLFGVVDERKYSEEALTAEWGDGSVDRFDEDTFTMQL